MLDLCSNILLIFAHIFVTPDELNIVLHNNRLQNVILQSVITNSLKNKKQKLTNSEAEGGECHARVFIALLSQSIHYNTQKHVLIILII